MSMRPATPAILFPKRFSVQACQEEAKIAVRIARSIRGSSGYGWINFPLWNASGDPSGLELVEYVGTGRPTPYLGSFPYGLSILRELAKSGLQPQYARVAVLFERDVLRPHVDMYRALRFLIPLNEQANDFRHVFGSYCFSMRTGEVWGVNGSVCHGAANVVASGNRVVLIVDVDRTSSPSVKWLHDGVEIPKDRLIGRISWTRERRRRLFRGLRPTAVHSGFEAVERDLLFIPFEHEMAADQTYREILLFCRYMSLTNPLSIRPYWKNLAYETAHPALKFQVAPPPTRFQSKLLNQLFIDHEKHHKNKTIRPSDTGNSLRTASNDPDSGGENDVQARVGLARQPTES